MASKQDKLYLAALLVFGPPPPGPTSEYVGSQLGRNLDNIRRLLALDAYVNQVAKWMREQGCEYAGLWANDFINWCYKHESLVQQEEKDRE